MVLKFFAQKCAISGLPVNNFMNRLTIDPWKNRYKLKRTRNIKFKEYEVIICNCHPEQLLIKLSFKSLRPYPRPFSDFQTFVARCGKVLDFWNLRIWKLIIWNFKKKQQNVYCITVPVVVTFFQLFRGNYNEVTAVWIHKSVGAIIWINVSSGHNSLFERLISKSSTV